MEVLLSFLDNSSDVASPCQVLMDVNILIFEIVHPLIYSAVYDYWGMCDPSPPVVHNDLLGLGDIQGEVVMPAILLHCCPLLPVGCLVTAGDHPHNCRVVRKLQDGVCGLCRHTVVGVEGIQKGAEDTTLWCSGAESQ